MDARVSSLRLRKMRTRAGLIDAAVDLCLSRGYQDTTVEHIAGAAGVSPRTFARYFPTKASALLAVLDELGEEVAATLRVLPSEMGPLTAMRTALQKALASAHRERFHSRSGDRIVRVVTASEALRRAAIVYRSPPVEEAMARRFKAGTEDGPMELGMTLISVIVLHAWNVVAASGALLTSPLIGEELDRTFVEFATLVADLDAGEPDQGRPEGGRAAEPRRGCK